MGKPLLNAMFFLLAPAKINLYLKVLYKRPDGYHEIDTLLQAVSLFDRLTFYPDSKIRVLTKGRRIPQKDNLVTKALLLLQEYTGLKKGIRVVIEKKIPVAAGLGGGSSDAAAALLGACRLWQLPLGLSELSYLGAQIGSDVPFFFTSGQARARGRGEKLVELPLPTDYSMALACPHFAVSTPWAYQALNLSLTSVDKGGNFLTAKIKRTVGEDPRRFPRALSFSNDLEAPVVRRFPEVEEIKRAFLAAGFGPVLMSGSGPAVWAVLPEKTDRPSGAGRMKKQSAMIRKLLPKTGITPRPRFFIVRPLAACVNVLAGGRPA
ncbi:MAG: 4-(cytidine 5'-diphospho)-2-C-methyl-D-erythritol kinase [candidate division Zixibacteria bacterium]|nr:4-(cytidine 5'-diphospho)-2-C-methyl-D-erythritol kinase [candidate division Zixibacteria bacterium]